MNSEERYAHRKWLEDRGSMFTYPTSKELPKTNEDMLKEENKFLKFKLDKIKNELNEYINGESASGAVILSKSKGLTLEKINNIANWEQFEEG